MIIGPTDLKILRMETPVSTIFLTLNKWNSLWLKLSIQSAYNTQLQRHQYVIQRESINKRQHIDTQTRVHNRDVHKTTLLSLDDENTHIRIINAMKQEIWKGRKGTASSQMERAWPKTEHRDAIGRRPRVAGRLVQSAGFLDRMAIFLPVL